MVSPASIYYNDFIDNLFSKFFDCANKLDDIFLFVEGGYDNANSQSNYSLGLTS